MLYVRHSVKCFSDFISSNPSNNLQLGTIIIMSMFIILIDDETEVWRHEPRSHRKEGKSGFEHRLLTMKSLHYTGSPTADVINLIP